MNNIYDDKAFFDAYSRMARSTGGLEAAGEWHQLPAAVPCHGGQPGTGSGLRLWLALQIRRGTRAPRKCWDWISVEKMIAEARALQCRPPASGTSVCGIAEYRLSRRIL